LQSDQEVTSLRSHCRTHGLDFNFAKGFLLSGALEGYVQWQEILEPTWSLTEKGTALQGEIPGVLLAEKLQRGVNELDVLQTLLGRRFSLGFGALRREQAVEMRSQDQTKTINVIKPEVLAAFPARQATLVAIADGQPVPADAPPLDWLEAQGWIAQTAEADYRITVLDALKTLDLQPVVTTLTSDLILSGQWRQVDLKPYNIHDDVPDVGYGRPTILTQCIQRIRDIFLNMGFDEMSGYIVEPAFWNFDVLFTPQDHPARDEQDTFYLSQPQQLPLPEDTGLIAQVKQAHEDNYSGTWTEAEASRAILRAHTTSSTARKLYELQGKTGKYFSIDKVFRNETVDRTHLAEFHQIEGVIIGELLSVRTLMGYLTYFYERLGFENVKFKPTYNPYTEPSLEVFAYHPPSQRYLEVGNSGLFRPEMLKPLGCEGVSTIAWGLGLERIAMLLYGVEKLSDLIGPDIRLDGAEVYPPA
ncbi:phenylalanine--tRNA ligase subunit alpha, partial [filamentous cyanobacterium CCP5]